MAGTVGLNVHQPGPSAPPDTLTIHGQETGPDLERAGELLDQGAYDEAALSIAALIAADPGEAAAWFLQARLLAGRGHHAEAQEACRRAIELWPDILPVYCLLAEMADRTGGDASGWLVTGQRMLLAQHPKDAVLANRIGMRLCTEGRFDEALPYLRQAAPVLGHQDSALWNYTTSLALTGRYHELLSIEPLLTTLSRDVPPPFGPFAHLAAAKLAFHFDRNTAQREIEAAQASPRWIGAAQLADRIADAITQHQSFSIILLSEGHARLVAHASLKIHLILSEAEMSAVVNSVWMSAFGDPIETHGAAAAGALSHRLLAAVAEADVVAMPDSVHLATAHEHFGFLAEMQRIVLQRPTGSCAGLAVMSEMHEAMPFLHPLLINQPFLGYVGSQANLAERLARFAQIGKTTTYLVPAPRDKPSSAEETHGPEHFPGLFEQTLAALHVPFPGAV